MESILIEDPIFSLKLNFNAEGNDTYLIKEMTDQKVAALPEKINMTWEAVYSRATNVENLYDMPGLNIISPVWYDLTDGSGTVKSKKQDDYIEWADNNGYILWPAVTNGFDPDMTHELITSFENRTTFIDKMVDLYSGNDFHGINIDFENIYKDDKYAISQFIAELTAAFHRKGMLVSIDVTFGGGSDNWSKCYDRRILGQWVDFVVVMSYDEHWGSSPVSGSVASLNWLDRNLAILLSEVESDKVIMGIPFYMRVWFERPSKEVVNHMKVTSDAITMHKMESILENGDYNVLWDEAAGQNYISFIDSTDNAVKKIWIEDEESLRVKLSMVHKYNLKGIASWRRGYELESIWPMLDEELRK
jgi:spore germination protein YaaH